MSIVIFRFLQFRLLLFSPFVLLFSPSWSAAKLGIDAWWSLWCFDINSTYLKLNTTFLLPSECYWRGLFNLSEKTGNNCLWRRTTQEVRYEAKSKPQSFKLNPKLKTKGRMTSSAIRLRGPSGGRRGPCLKKSLCEFFVENKDREHHWKVPGAGVLEISQYKHFWRWPGLCSLGGKSCRIHLPQGSAPLPGGLFCCVWTAESHFLIWILNKAGHSLFISESNPCEKVAGMFTPWAWSQLDDTAFSWSFPSLFPNLPCSKMPRYKKLPVGMPALQSAVTVYTKAHLFSFWMQTPVASRHTEHKSGFS